MADSNNKKSTTTNAATDKKTATNASKASAKSSTTKSAAAKASTNKAATTKATTTAKTTTKPAADTKKPATTEKTAKAKNVEKPTDDAKSKTPAKAATNQKAPEKSAEPKPQKRSGGGMAFLALLCSLAALGLSGYSFYEQQMSKADPNQEALLSGVNDIKSNVTEFGSIVSGLQQDVQDFKASQANYITKDTLDDTVKQSVDLAVDNLPDLPNIGPAAIADVKSQADTNSSGNTSEAETDTSAEPDNANPTSSDDSTDAAQTADNTAAEAESEEDSAWSWGRAKQDFNDMIKGFIKVEKIEKN